MDFQINSTINNTEYIWMELNVPRLCDGVHKSHVIVWRSLIKSASIQWCNSILIDTEKLHPTVYNTVCTNFEISKSNSDELWHCFR